VTAPVPPSVETLAVQLAALRDKLNDALIYRDREEKIRVEELSAWRHSHNEILASADKTNTLMLPKTEYAERHRALEQKIEATTKALADKMEAESKFLLSRLDRMDMARNGIKEDVVKLTARAGYVSIGLIVSIGAALISLFGIWMDFIHSLVTIKP
jgi:hypothetical protein